MNNQERAKGWPPMSPFCRHAPRGACPFCTPGSIWLWHKDWEAKKEPAKK